MRRHRGDTSKWRHGIPRSSISRGGPRVSMVFGFAHRLVVVPVPFLLERPSPESSAFLPPRGPSCPPTPSLRRSLPYPRLFNSHAWARAPRPSLFISLYARYRDLSLFLCSLSLSVFYSPTRFSLFFFFPLNRPHRRSARCTRAEKHAPLNAIIAWSFGEANAFDR